MTDLEKLKNLTELVSMHAYNYYVLDNPLISDAEYDKLYDEMRELEKKLNIVLENSITNKIGGEPVKKFSSHTHIEKLYSLDKAKNVEELYAWKKRVLKEQETVFSLEYKFDGLTLVLTYENGKFIYAATRGNGAVGEEVTEQVRTINSVPLNIEYKGKLEVCGEGIMKLSDLKKYNETASEPLKNARNGVAGAIRNLDPKITKERNLDIIFYSVNYIEDGVLKSQNDAVEFLKRNKFKTSSYFKLYKNIDEIIDSLKQIENERMSLDFLIDGAVIKVNDFSVRKNLGYTEKFPKWAIAYKFEAEEVTTILTDVVWNVGRTGKVTPLAYLEPVELAGAKISRATLNNYGDIQRKKIKLNCRVLLRRSNDVIPEILGVTEYYDNCKEIDLIENCPECKSKLKEDGANVFCFNKECAAKIVQGLIHFASKSAMDIEGLSERTILSLYQKLGVKYSYQLYLLKTSDLQKLEGFKDKKTDNILTAIAKSLSSNLENFIYALGIENVGSKLANDLSSHFKTLEGLKTAKYDELIKIYDVGDAVAGSIVEYFNDQDNLENIDKLLKLGLKFKEVKKPESGKFLNQTVVITGTLENYKRTELEKIITNLGGNVSSAVTKQTTLLICGADAGGKLERAKELNIKIIFEEELLKILNDQ